MWRTAVQTPRSINTGIANLGPKKRKEFSLLSCLLTSMHTTIFNLKSNLKIPLTIIGKIATSASPHPHILIWIRKPGYDATSMLIVSSGRSTRPNQLHLNHSIIYMTTILSMTLSGRILNSVGPSKQ